MGKLGCDACPITSRLLLESMGRLVNAGALVPGTDSGGFKLLIREAVTFHAQGNGRVGPSSRREYAVSVVLAVVPNFNGHEANSIIFLIYTCYFLFYSIQYSYTYFYYIVLNACVA